MPLPGADHGQTFDDRVSKCLLSCNIQGCSGDDQKDIFNNDRRFIVYEFF